MCSPDGYATSQGSSTALVHTPIGIKQSAGNLYGYHVFNPAGAITYIQVFDSPSVGVIVGSTAPTFVIGVNTLGTVDISLDWPIAFLTGISVTATTTPTGSTSPGTGAVVSFRYI